MNVWREGSCPGGLFPLQSSLSHVSRAVCSSCIVFFPNDLWSKQRQKRRKISFWVAKIRAVGIWGPPLTFLLVTAFILLSSYYFPLSSFFSFHQAHQLHVYIPTYWFISESKRNEYVQIYKKWRIRGCEEEVQVFKALIFSDVISHASVKEGEDESYSFC